MSSSRCDHPAIPRRRAVAFGLAAALFAGAAEAAAAPAGSVDALRGDAFVQDDARRRALALGAAVFVGDLVETDVRSNLGLRLGAATRVRLGPEARLRIDRFLLDVGGVLELARGAMVLDHDPASGRAEMTVRSPFGLIAVRGTKFFAGPSNGVFGVFVISGAVRVVGDHIAVELGPGLGTDIARPGADPTEPKRWAPARVERALASVG